jgi:hypothetical protein
MSTTLAGSAQILLRLDRRVVGDRVELEAGDAGLLLLDGHADRATLAQLAEQHLVGERLLDVLLDHAAERTRAHALVIALVGQPLGALPTARRSRRARQAGLRAADELLDHLVDDLHRQRPNGMMASRRLRNSGVNSRLIASMSSPARAWTAEADRGLLQSDGARIRRHDQDHVAEVDLLAVVVGQLDRGP